MPGRERKAKFYIVYSVPNLYSCEFGLGILFGCGSFGCCLLVLLLLCPENLAWLSAYPGHTGCWFLCKQTAQPSGCGPQNRAREKCGLHLIWTGSYWLLALSEEVFLSFGSLWGDSGSWDGRICCRLFKGCLLCTWGFQYCQKCLLFVPAEIWQDISRLILLVYFFVAPWSEIGQIRSRFSEYDRNFFSRLKWNYVLKGKNKHSRDNS